MVPELLWRQKCTIYLNIHSFFRSSLWFKKKKQKKTPKHIYSYWWFALLSQQGCPKKLLITLEIDLDLKFNPTHLTSLIFTQSKAFLFFIQSLNPDGWRNQRKTPNLCLLINDILYGGLTVISAALNKSCGSITWSQTSWLGWKIMAGCRMRFYVIL